MKWLIGLFVPMMSFAINLQDVRSLMNPPSNEVEIDKHRFIKSTEPYFIDLNNDKINENIRFTYADGHYYISISEEAEVLANHKIRVEGGNSRIQRFYFEDIGEGMGAVLIVISEGTFSTIDALEKQRIDLVTFNQKNLKESYYYEGPLVSYSQSSWDSKKRKLSSFISFIKFPNQKIKSVLIEDEQTSFTLTWNRSKKTWE